MGEMPHVQIIWSQLDQASILVLARRETHPPVAIPSAANPVHEETPRLRAVLLAGRGEDRQMRHGQRANGLGILLPGAASARGFFDEGSLLPLGCKGGPDRVACPNDE